MTKPHPAKTILEALKIALQLEKEGRKFFVDASNRIESELARKTFDFLAKEEEKHLARITEFYESIESTDKVPEMTFDEEEAKVRIEQFSSRIEELKDEIHAGASDVEAYEFALKFENGAEEFYEKQMKESDNIEVRRFYRWLIREEKMHSSLLRSCLEFAENPAAWFEQRKKD